MSDPKSLSLLWLAKLLTQPPQRGSNIIYELGGRVGGEFYLENYPNGRGPRLDVIVTRAIQATKGRRHGAGVSIGGK